MGVFPLTPGRGGQGQGVVEARRKGEAAAETKSDAHIFLRETEGNGAGEEG